MFNFSEDEKFHLNSFQKKYLNEIKKLKLNKPYLPWTNKSYVCFEGIFACGWTKEDFILLIKYDGYCLINPRNGEVVLEDYSEVSYNLMSKNNLIFNAKIIDELVNIFGLYGGKGNLVTSDGWKLNILHPNWPNSVVSIGKAKIEEDSNEIWNNIRLLFLKNL